MTRNLSTLFKRIQALQAKTTRKGIASSVSVQVTELNGTLVSYYFEMDGKYHSHQASDSKYLHLDIQEFNDLEQQVINYMDQL